MSRPLAAIALLATLLAGCAGTAVSQARQPPSPSGSSASASPPSSPAAATPGPFPVATDVTCPDLRSVGLTRYLERPSDFNRKEAVLCDASQLARPLAIHELDSAQTVVFLSDTVIGYLQQSGNGPSDASSSIRTLDLTNRQVTTVATSQAAFVGSIGWSHDRSMVAFTTDTGSDHHFWFKRGSAAPGELTSPIQLFGRGGVEGDEGLVAFSPDDQYVLIVDTPVYRLEVFRTSDGSVAYTAPSGAGGLRTMATWAPGSDQMYFRNDSGVFRWDPTSGISSFAAGLKWEYPLFSPDGKRLVYTVWDASGKTHIVIRDMANGTTSSSPEWRLSKEFLSSAVLLEGVTQACGQGPCGPFAQTEATRTLQIDSGAEGQLPMPSGWGLDAFVPGH